MKEKKSKKDVLILKIIFGALLLFNLIYFGATFFPAYIPRFLMNFHTYYLEHKLFLSILELIGALTLLVDAVLTHDKLKQPQRFLYLLIVALFIMAWLFKAFVGYLQAVFDFPS